MPIQTAIEKNTWFHLSNSCCMGILYNLLHINEICREHVDNNFHPLPDEYMAQFERITTRTVNLFNDVIAMTETDTQDTVTMLRQECDRLKDSVSDTYHRLFDRLREGDPSSMTVMYVYVNMLQETQEMVSALRKYLRAFAKLQNSDFSSRHLRPLQGCG